MRNRFGGVTLQIVRDWVLRFNAKGPDGLISRKVPSKAPILNDEQRRAPVENVESGLIPASHGIVGYRLIDLVQWVSDEFGLSTTKQTLSREMRALGYHKLSARPRHQGPRSEVIAGCKKFPRPFDASPGKPSPKHPNRVVVAGWVADR
jgi:transposase